MDLSSTRLLRTRPMLGMVALLGMAVLLGAGIAACTGIVSDPGGTIPPPGPTGPMVRPDGSFACTDGALSVSPLRRLSALQYENTIHDLFAESGLDATTAAATEIARLPVDEAGSTFRILDARVSAQHVRAYYRIADCVASYVASDDGNLAALAGDCALDAAPTAACIDAFLSDFGLRAFRRPLTDDERARYHALNDGTRDTREVFRALVFSILMAPALVYHVEVDGDGDDARYTLDAYALASRLSYHFWQSTPDAPLLAAAADGSLLTEAGYAAELDRMMNDPRTEDTIATFWGEWLQLDWLGAFPTTPAFTTFAEGTTIGEPGADHLEAMGDEIRAMTRHFTFETAGTLDDLFLTDLSFTESPHLAAIYGVEPWDGVGDYPTMPAGERAGLLTRAAFLLTGTEETHPVHRGAAVRRRILCDDLPQPDPASLPPGSLDSPPVTADLTTRERYAQKTANEPCATCHTQINPIGFVLERYDAIGRLRTEERVIDQVTGEVIATLPIDSSAAPRIGAEEPATIASGVELSQSVVDSNKVEGCFARQYFRFTYGREEIGEDGCALERVRGTLASGGSLREALRAIAEEPSFRSRRVL